MEYYYKATVSTFISVSILHPLDTIKVNIQNNKKIIYNFKNLYKGYFIGLSYSIPEKSAKIATYDTLKNKYNLNNQTSSIIASLAQVAIGTPGEYLKSNYQNKSINIIKFKNVYKGFTLQMLRDVPFALIFFNTYEKLNNYTNKFNSGLISAGISAGFVTPIDYAKTRYQTSNDSLKYTLKYLKNNFYKSFNSLPHRVISIGCFYGINMCIYDLLK
jgi:hypothetical protein